MSASKDDNRASRRKRKHNDDEGAVNHPSKKSRTDQSQQHRVSNDDNNIDEPVLRKASRREHKREKRKDKKSGSEKAQASSSRASKSPSIQNTSRRERKKRSLKVKEGDAEEKLDGADSHREERDEAVKEARKQKRAAKRLKKAAEKAQDDESKALVQQTQSHEIDVLQKPAARGWTTSTPSAGRYLDHDPIFVQDDNGEQFLISSNGRELQVLSLEASLVVRTHLAPSNKTVVAFTLDALSDNIVLIGYSDGTIAKWDWTDNLQPHDRSRAEDCVISMASAPGAADNKAELFYTAKIRKQYGIFKHSQKSLLYSTMHKLRGILTLGNGEYIVSYRLSTLILGKRKNQEGTLGDFVFIELPLSTSANCIDARLVQDNKKGSNRNSRLSVAIGYQSGQIHLYEDLSWLFSTTSRPGQNTLPTPRILHWHREAVSSVKFSRDGNYLISGGKETVLVIWQLQTGKKQFLPHLTSEIERIVVNPEGDRYALQMGDNSIMVLSTSELKPVAHFAGLQMMSAPSDPNRKARAVDHRAVAATLHPQESNRLLITVPSSQPESSEDVTSRPFLQIFDTRHSRHISRQALTRNNVTDFNLGPESTPIIPPDVVHVAISHDGSWLATVDEWMPPASDLEHLCADSTEVHLEREKRREVYLKTWHWDEQTGIWTLSTRVDAPHARVNGDALGAGLVLALESDPVSNGFATIGEDSIVKFWKPRRRRQDGDEIEWRCRWTLQIPSAAETELDNDFEDLQVREGGREACMAFSGDGSLLAVSVRQSPSANVVDQQTPLVHFVDTFSGTIATSKSGLAKTEIHALGFLGRYFIAVAQPAAYVWDLVEERLAYKIELSSHSNPRPYDVPILATNPGDDTFAIVVERKKLEIYRPQQSTRLYEQRFEVGVEAVLSTKGRSGFVLLSEDATVRTVSSSGTFSRDGAASSRAVPAPITSSAHQVESDHATDVEDEIPDLSASANRLLNDEDTPATTRIQVEEDDRPVVRPEQLASIFDVPHSFAMPPVKDMFQAVVGLFGRKPLQVV